MITTLLEMMVQSTLNDGSQSKKKITVLDKRNNEVKEFESYNTASLFYGYKKNYFNNMKTNIGLENKTFRIIKEEENNEL